ncbi:polysaccharide deacteylase family 2 protein [Parasedimentitalea psychrophila]|uniref:Divergent polysaccharide deacetylase family protein n=1 Tax=Parasedimentitalea psychrophila TaxID=2997337 RepID=A0A9Y2P6E4_9RHOB|nr:polysaccharide deacteylase family 2 protein [Parasedimentitalea psychrophila]WIY24918.1 divergent polysaccharide deacetylase family protein [Parasedimentitalea psychrophila]
MREFLGGISLGAVVAVGGAAMLSLSAPLPNVVDVTVQTPSEASEPTKETGLPTDTPGPDAHLVEVAPVAPTGEAGDILSRMLQDVDTQTASRPLVATTGTALSDTVELPGDGGSSPNVAVQMDVAVVPVDPLPVPLAPSPEAEIVVSSEPAQPPQATVMPQLPELDLETSEAPAPQIADNTADGAEGGPSTGRGADLEASPDMGVAPIAPEGAAAAPVTVPELSAEVPSLQAPDSGTMPVSQLPVVTTAPAEQFVPGESRNTAEAQDETQGQPGERVAALPTTTGGRDTSEAVTIGTPVVPLTERNTETTGGNYSAAQLESPFDAYAESFTNLEGRPLMAIVLIDDAQSIGAEALVGFPYPLSFAIDPEDPNAVEKMHARRASGFEVLILTDLPREAAPQDAETALAVWFETLPESIAVLEGTGTGFQGNRPLADQVSAVVAASGRGLLTQNHGLNTVQKLAARDGVPASVVFRDFDGAGQNPKAIRRFLDQAAFRAGQEGAVIMLGRVRPDTISALLLWGLQDRASRVALAPVSVALSHQTGDN